MKKTLVVVVFCLLLWSCMTVWAWADEFKGDYRVGLSVPLSHSLDLRQGWQEKNFADLGIGIIDQYWDEPSVHFLARFSPGYTCIPLVFFSGLSLGLGYKDIPDVSESSRTLVIIGGDLGFFWQGLKLTLSDYLKIRFLSPYTPLEKIESNQFEVLAVYYFGENIEVEAQYGFTNWRPYDDRQVGLLALGRVRLGHGFGWADNHLVVVGYQALSQRFASDSESWRWLSGLGFFGTLQKYPFKLDLCYGWGKYEKACWWFVEKTSRHQIGLKVILGQ